MLHHEETKRPTLAELRRLLKAKKNGRRSISRSEKEKSYSTEMYWINDFCIISLVSQSWVINWKNEEITMAQWWNLPDHLYFFCFCSGMYLLFCYHIFLNLFSVWLLYICAFFSIVDHLGYNSSINQSISYLWIYPVNNWFS